MTRGEVWWVERPRAPGRPHLVLTRAAVVPVVERVIAVPATRTIRGIPTEVELTVEDGMPARCVLSLDNITLVQKSYCVERICRLSPERMAEVCRALALATDCAYASA